jgi:hypothetical protein
MQRAASVLVVVPRVRSTIEDRESERRLVTVAEAYTGTLFPLSRQYVEGFGDAWVLLSAKYGLVAPNFSTPEPYGGPFEAEHHEIAETP